MSSRAEWEELDCRLDAAWLAEVSDAAPDGSVAKQVPTADRSSTSVSTGSPAPADSRVSARIERDDLDCKLDAAWLAQVSVATPDGVVAEQLPTVDRSSTPTKADRSSTTVSMGSLAPAEPGVSAGIERKRLDCGLDAAWLAQVFVAARLPKIDRGSTPTSDRSRISVSTSSLAPADARRSDAVRLAQISDAAPDGLVAKAYRGSGSTPKADRGSTTISTSSLTPAGRPVRQEVSHAPRRRSGPVTMVMVGLFFAVALAAGSAIHTSLMRPPVGPTLESGSSKSLTSTTAEVPGRPKLIVGPLVGVAGQPVPIGLGLAGQTNDAVVVIRGLLPGMEVSTGDLVGPDTWQLAAADLRYAWIAPPSNFVGSTDFVAELRLPNAQIADRQTVRVTWMTRGAGDEPEQGNNTRQQEVDASRPVASTTVQHPNDPGVITAAPPVSAGSSENQLARQEGKNFRARGKNSLRRSLEHGSRRAPSETRRIGDSTQAVKGFWDWSR